MRDGTGYLLSAAAKANLNRETDKYGNDMVYHNQTGARLAPKHDRHISDAEAKRRQGAGE